jgi:RimJ/RimL family protein N-acetyltransferase
MDIRQFFKLTSKRLIFFVGITVLIGGSFIGYQWYTHEDLTPIRSAPTEIRGKKVILRKLKDSYFIDFHNMFSRDVRQNIEFSEYTDLDYTIRILRYDIEQEKAGKKLIYCIFDAKENKLIGALEIREKNDDDPGQFGCWLNENYRGGGRIQEAIKLISNIYFRLTHEKSFIAHVRLWNTRSYKALLRAGFIDTKKFYYEDSKPTRYLLEFKKEN